MAETLPDYNQHEKYRVLQESLMNVCKAEYDGENAAEIASVLQKVCGAFLGSVDIDKAEAHENWGGQSVGVVTHPVTGENFHVFFTANGPSVKVGCVDESGSEKK